MLSKNSYFKAGGVKPPPGSQQFRYGPTTSSYDTQNKFQGGRLGYPEPKTVGSFLSPQRGVDFKPSAIFSRFPDKTNSPYYGGTDQTIGLTNKYKDYSKHGQNQYTNYRPKNRFQQQGRYGGYTGQRFMTQTPQDIGLKNVYQKFSYSKKPVSGNYTGSSYNRYDQIDKGGSLDRVGYQQPQYVSNSPKYGRQRLAPNKFGSSFNKQFLLNNNKLQPNYNKYNQGQPYGRSGQLRKSQMGGRYQSQYIPPRNAYTGYKRQNQPQHNDYYGTKVSQHYGDPNQVYGRDQQPLNYNYGDNQMGNQQAYGNQKYSYQKQEYQRDYY